MFHQSKSISAIKRIGLFSTTAMHVSSSSFMYLCIPGCYDACLKSSALRVGVKTLHNTIQLTAVVLEKFLFQHLLLKKRTNEFRQEDELEAYPASLTSKEIISISTDGELNDWGHPQTLTGLVDWMTAVVPHQSYMTQHPSLFALINHCVTVFSFALMSAIVVGLLSAVSSCSAPVCWLSHMKQ